MKEELEIKGHILEANEEPNIEEGAKANVPATKSTHSKEASKLDAGKKSTTKPFSALQYDKQTIRKFRYLDKARKPLGVWWKIHIPQPQDEEHVNMAIDGESRDYGTNSLAPCESC